MRIGFVSLDHLRDWTGITRLIDQIAAEMALRGHNITLIACEGKVSESIPVSPRAYPHELIALNLESNAGRLDARRIIAASGLDICVTSIGSTKLLYLPWLFAGSGIPFVIGESADPRIFTYERWQPYEHYGVLASADAIQVLLAYYLPFYPEPLQPRITVIGNPIPPPVEVNLEERRSKQTHTLLGVGRFNDADKRFSLLIRAFSILQRDFPAWRLKLVGDGPYWEFYHLMVEQLGITELVEFTGATANPEAHYADADLFCLSSRAEGFAMVLAEAASCALPLVGFQSCVSAQELIRPDMGSLVDDTGRDTPEALAEALRPLMALPASERELYGIRARDFFQINYRGRIIFDAWERLLEQTFKQSQKNGSTVLERIEDSNMTDEYLKVGEAWEGLGPQSALWSQELLEDAAREITQREDPLKAPDVSRASEETESIRLRNQLAELRRDYDRLDHKYGSLLAQFQTLAGQSRAKRKKR